MPPRDDRGRAPERQRILQIWMPAFERVKKSPSRLKCRPQRRTREGGYPYKSLFQLEK